MSDPVTDADIEDVLAQVRRLVLQAAPREPARTGPRAPARTRLVLTPAQRVGEGPAGATSPGEEPGNGPAPKLAQAHTPEAPLLLSDPLVGGSRRAEEAREIEIAVGMGAWEPDGSEAAEWTLGGVLGEDLDASPEASAPAVFRRRAHGVGPAEADPSLVRPVAAAPSTAPPSPERSAQAVPALDEDVLRALVVEVVRAELRGELGERITRNLRKLVRREVFRALESRDER
jgi:hypothetical protein